MWQTSLEVAYAFTDAFGVEVFVPITRSEIPGVSATGIGDLEIQLLKWSLLRRENLILTAVLGGLLPTGDETEGLGSGLWAVEPHLFMDAVIGPVAVQVNGIYGFIEGGEQEVEFGASVARMFFVSERTSLGPMLEAMGGRVTRGDEAGEWEGFGLAPGAKLQVGGWHYGLGVRLPLVDDDPSDVLLIATVGYHVAF